MNEEFHRRQLEADQKLEQQQASQQTHATMETYHIAQHEANVGHFETPGASGERHVPEAPPSLWQRLKKLLGMS